MADSFHVPARLWRRHRVAIGSTVLLVLALTACGPYMDAPRPPVFSTPVSVPAPSDRVAAHDVLIVTVAGEPDLSGAYGVDDAGTIALPLAGPVDVTGKTITEVTDAIIIAYKNGYLVNPQVTVDKKAADAVYVMGAVNVPGSYAWMRDTSVAHAALAAGGFRAGADTQTFEVIRGGRAMPATPDDAVNPGDVVVVKAKADQ